MTPEGLFTFVLASVLLGLAPGPDNLFVLVQSATHGRRAGIMVSLGLCTGLLVHTAAVTLGVAALVQASNLAFTILKVIGATYLLWLAWQAWKSAAVSLDRSAPVMNPWRLYARGIIMNVTNVKVLMFFLAFLPQFIAAEEGYIHLQIIILGALFVAATLVVFSSVAFSCGESGKVADKKPRGPTLVEPYQCCHFCFTRRRLSHDRNGLRCNLDSVPTGLLVISKLFVEKPTKNASLTSHQLG